MIFLVCREGAFIKEGAYIRQGAFERRYTIADPDIGNAHEIFKKVNRDISEETHLLTSTCVSNTLYEILRDTDFIMLCLLYGRYCEIIYFHRMKPSNLG